MLGPLTSVGSGLFLPLCQYLIPPYHKSLNIFETDTAARNDLPIFIDF